MEVFARDTFVRHWILNERIITGGSKKKPFEFIVWAISRNLYNFVKIFAQNFFVGNRISNKRVTTRRRKTSFKMRWNLWIFMKNFAEKFFVKNWILNKRATTRGRKRPFNFSFWLISWNRISMKIFAKNFEQTCHCRGSKENEIETKVSPPGLEKALLNSVFGR